MMTAKIAVWGNSGSGKSTFAAALGVRLGMPVFHLDKIAWRQGWQFGPESELLRAQRAWIDQPCWIIDGVGTLQSVRERFAAAGLILELRASAALCRERAAQRIASDAVKPDPYMAAGCRYGEVVDLQWKVIVDFEQVMRAEILGMLAAEFGDKVSLQLDARVPTETLCALAVEAVEAATPKP